jgi:DNA-binding GntR family transcriptional regulator
VVLDSETEDLSNPPDRAGGARARPPATAGDHVARYVRAEILRGRFPLGSRLDQQALADEVGVSNIPVREALRRLAAEGLVRLPPRRGAFVADVSDAELTEIVRIRCPLEDQATRLAVPRLDSRRLDLLERLNRSLGETTPNPRETAWADLNRQWHFELYAAADSPLLLQLISFLWDRYSLYRQVNASHLETRILSVAEHEEVLRCLRAADAGGAARAVRRHIQRRAQNMRQTIGSRAGRESV